MQQPILGIGRRTKTSGILAIRRRTFMPQQPSQCACVLSGELNKVLMHVFLEVLDQPCHHLAFTQTEHMKTSFNSQGFQVIGGAEPKCVYQA